MKDFETDRSGRPGFSGEKSADEESGSVSLDGVEREHQVRKMESLGILAGGIAHDFNNLLMGVLGNADLALSVMAPDAAGRDQVEDIVVAAQRAADLAGQMLAYSGRGRFNVEQVDLGSLVADSIHLLKARASSSVVLQVEPPQAELQVSVDVAQLKQVLLNLVANASDAIRERSGVIRISTFEQVLDQDAIDRMYVANELQPGRYVVLEVTDTGCGIEPQTLGRIFDPFFTTKFTGRGLGLAAVLGIVRGHRGGLDVRSKARRGSTFSVVLPFAEERMETEAGSSPGDNRRLVLVIDDESTVLDISRAYLEKAGFAVLTAEDGLKGIEILRENAAEVDCIILDYTMPGMGGRETLTEIRAIRSDVTVILSSGYDESDVVRQMDDGSVSGFIQKPYGAAALIERLRAAGVVSR